MSEELKPCPFCGGEAIHDVEYYEREHYNSMDECHFISCKNDCITGCYTTGDTKEEAIKAWNRRPSPWHTEKPTEEGWYLAKVTDVEKPYEVLKFENGKWSDYLDYDDVPEVVNDSFVLAYQKIEPFKESE